MRRLKIAGLALIAVLVASAMVSTTASAKATKLDFTWTTEEKQLEPGQEFRMANDTAVTIETTSGDVQCHAAGSTNEQGFIGTDLTNDEKTDDVEVKYAYGAIAGKSLCASTVPLGNSAYVSIFDYDSLGTLSLGSNQAASFKSRNAETPVYIFLGFNSGEECVYDFTKLKGTIALEPYYVLWNQVVITFAQQKLKLYKAESGKLCPKTAQLTAPFQYQITEPVPGSGWYILGKLV